MAVEEYDEPFYNTAKEAAELKQLVSFGVDIGRPLEEQSPEIQAIYHFYNEVKDRELVDKKRWVPIIPPDLSAGMYIRATASHGVKVEGPIHLLDGGRIWLGVDSKRFWLQRGGWTFERRVN